MTHAIGGNASIVGNYRVHIFTGGYSSLEIDEAGDLEYLIVAGGGAGGADHGGGGGGGQVITGSAYYSEGIIDVYVGAGGLLGTGRGVFGTNGENSYLGNLVAIGGGRGGQFDNVAGNTGSSGGGGASFSGGGLGGLPLVSGTTGQAGASGNNSGAGGGGGAATPGQQSEGGNGIISDLTGVSLMYGSGGGGADRIDGVGGDGAGSGNQVSGTMSGLPNRGGGGGGNTSQLSGSFGGSGIVAVRYLFAPTGRRQIQTTDIDLQCSPLTQYSDTKSNIESLTGTLVGAVAYANDNPTAPFGIYTAGGWHWYSTGSAGGSVSANDEGISKGAFTVLNVVSGNADISVSGTVARLFITGSSLNFQDEGVPLGIPGTVNFVGDKVSVTISGTVARVFITGTPSAIDGLSPTNNDILQYKSGSWVNRTLTQLLADFPIAVGTYTPTISNDSNVSASSLNQDFLYIRILGYVIVAGSINATHDGSGFGLVGITLPIASNFGTSYDLNGNATNVGAAFQNIGSVIADATNDKAQLAISQAVGTGSLAWRIVFVYRII